MLANGAVFAKSTGHAKKAITWPHLLTALTEGKKTNMSTAMTKSQLVAAIADAMGADKKTATAALVAIADVVAREVAKGGAVTLPGLGKMACRARPERQVRNPATGESITKAADKSVKFAIAKSLKDMVNS